METVSGKALMVTVGYRLPIEVYQRIVAKAESEEVKLSKVLRRITSLGLQVEDETEQEQDK